MQQISPEQHDAWTQEERDLIAQAKNDPRHFEKVYVHYLPRVFRFLASRTSSREVAEDLTSQTFLKALDHISSYEPRYPFGAWLFRIARNLLIDTYRVGNRTVSLDEATAGEETDLLDEIDRKDQRAALHAAMRQLDPADHELLSLRIDAELSHREIGDLLGKSEAAAKMAYMRAVRSLRDILSP